MSSQRNRIDVVRRANAKDDVDDPSRMKSTRQESMASIRTDSSEASALAEDKEVTRKKKTVEKNKLTRMIENHGESPTTDGDSPSKSDEERRQRFEGSFSNAASTATKIDKKTRSKRRAGARNSSSTPRLSKRNQTLLDMYYEKTEILDPAPDAPPTNGRRPATMAPQAHLQEDIQDYSKKKSLIEDTKRSMGIHRDDDSCSAASLVGDLASTRFSSGGRSLNDDDEFRRRLGIREDIITASAAKMQRRQRWQRFDQPGAVQMQGRAFGAPPRPPDAKPTMVIGLSPKSQAGDDVERLVKEGVTFTAAGPLVQATPVTPEECAPRALLDRCRLRRK